MNIFRFFYRHARLTDRRTKNGRWTITGTIQGVIGHHVPGLNTDVSGMLNEITILARLIVNGKRKKKRAATKTKQDELLQTTPIKNEPLKIHQCHNFYRL